MTSRDQAVHRADPEVWSLAVLYADGDVSRLRVNDDGSVTVLNVPKQRRPIRTQRQDGPPADR